MNGLPILKIYPSSLRGASGKTIGNDGKSVMQLALDLKIKDVELFALLRDSSREPQKGQGIRKSEATFLDDGFSIEDPRERGHTHLF